VNAEHRVDVHAEPATGGSPIASIPQVAIVFLLSLVAVSIGTGLVWNAFGRPSPGIDDAYIFFVYARNLADGHGFVYNVGGEAVEGFTSLLWTLICALAFRVWSTPFPALLVGSVVLVAVSLTIVIQSIRAMAPTRRWGTWLAALFASALLTEYGYLTWNTITLMDNALWSTQLTALAAATALGDPRSWRRSAGVALLTISLVLTRPEAVLWAPFFIAVLGLRAAHAAGVRAAMWVAVPPLLAYAATLGLLTAFRLSYFGYPLPNTYYAKMSPALSYSLALGVRYFASYIASGALPFFASLGAGIGVVHLAVTRRGFDAPGAAFLPAAAVALAVPVLTGGDHFGSFRFYQNGAPILVLGLAFTVSRVLPQLLLLRPAPGTPRRPLVVALAVSALAMLIVRATELRDFGEKSRVLSEFTLAASNLRNAAALERFFAASGPARPTIGVIAAGSIKFGYPGQVIDLMGLNNLRVAHNAGRRIGIKNHAAFEKKSLYELEPAIIVPTQVNATLWSYSPVELRFSFENRAFREIYDDAAFAAVYRFCRVTVRGGGNQPVLVGWFHRRLLDDVRRRPDLEIREFDYPRPL
jgi:arabinofuranosyltransferase